MFSGAAVLETTGKEESRVPKVAQQDPNTVGQRAFRNEEGAMQFVESVLEASTEFSIIATDDVGVIQLWNEGARRLYGYRPAEVVGQPESALHTHEDQTRRLSDTMMQGALDHGTWEGTVERRRKDGGTFTARVTVAPRRAADGTVSGFLLISRDITAEQRLAADGERSKYTLSLLESVPDAMVLVNTAGEIQLANAETERLFGYSRHELVGRPVELLMPVRYHEQHPTLRSEFFTEPLARSIGAEFDLHGRHRDGSEFSIEISLSPLQTPDGLLVIAAIRDITERRRFEQDLQDTNLRLKEASKAKDRFLANMSHELRTPLNAILGFSGTLLMGLAGPLNASQTQHLRTVQASSRHLLSLINDLLDLARIEAGKFELNVESINCCELLNEVALGLRPLAEEKGVELIMHAPVVGLTVRSDRRALSQILINLANNAIKFTDTGSVQLSAAGGDPDDHSGTCFRVVDTGRGIEVADQEQLFAAFEQIKSSSTQPYEGTGLGLYICQTLADLIAVAITFASVPGEGTTFTVELTEPCL